MKKIKFPLEMKNKIQVRTMGELRENFDIEKTVRYYLDGKLSVWLNDRYYDKEYKMVSELDASDSNLCEKLCEILGVEYKQECIADVGAIKNKNDKLSRLKQYTDSEVILENVDCTAMDQEELISILKNGCKTIYLCGDKFDLPLDYAEIQYIGVNHPTVVVSAEEAKLFYQNKISLVDISMPLELIYEARHDERYQRAEQFFFQHDFKNAAPIIEELCKEMNGRAFALGYYLYLDDSDMYDADDERAHEYLTKGKEIGDVICNILHALFVDKEQTKTEKFVRQKKMLKEMAEQGDALSDYVLGICYINETDEPIDYKLSVHYFTKCCHSGFYRAYNSLGLRYYKGQGVEKDFSKARQYYSRAAELNYGLSLYRLGEMYYYGNGVNKNEKTALEYYLKSGKQAYRDAESMLGWIYYNGKCGQEKNYSEGFRWDEKAAKKGCVNSINRLGVYYWEGNGVVKDMERAVEWLMKASDAGDKYGARNLGILYYEGKDVPKDWEKAKEFLSLAKQRGYEGLDEYLDIIEGNPAVLERVIKEIENIGNISLKDNYINASFRMSDFDSDREFRSRSSCQDYIRQICQRKEDEILKNFRMDNSEINDFVLKCQNEINSGFDKLNSAFLNLSIDTAGLTKQCEELKSALKAGMKNILDDSCYKTIDIERVISDTCSDGLYTYDRGSIHQRYSVSSIDPNWRMDKEAKEKWTKLQNDASVFLKQLLQALIMELRSKCNQIKLNR